MSRPLILIAGLLSLAVGCSTPSQAAAGRTAALAPSTDPQRWDRWACLRGELPPEVDARAFARARLEDLRASLNASASPFATARLRNQREEFEGRCQRWRREASLTAQAPTGGNSGI